MQPPALLPPIFEERLRLLWTGVYTTTYTCTCTLGKRDQVVPSRLENLPSRENVSPPEKPVHRREVTVKQRVKRATEREVYDKQKQKTEEQ